MATAKKQAAAKKTATPRTRVTVAAPAAETAPPPPPAPPKAAAKAEQPEDSVAVQRTGHVTVDIPTPFVLTRDDHTKVQYPKGTMSMPLADAEHWYSKAHGVTVRQDL